MISLQDKRRLIRGELSDLALYQALRPRAAGALAATLDAFVATETRHAAFWQNAFGLHDDDVPLAGRLRNAFITACAAFFGERATYLFLESVESHGIKVYLDLWDKLEGDEENRARVRGILTEELQHEDEAATGGSRAIDPGVVRNAFLGFNDGSVEILGAVVGLAAALGTPTLIAISAATVSAAGALSMAAGAFLSTHAERELQRLDAAKSRFLGGSPASQGDASPWRAATIVGTGYLIGAAVPVLPFFFGAQSPWWSIGLSGSLILLVSAFLSFLSGMEAKKRVTLNAVILVTAVLVSYGIGWMLDKVTT